MIAAKVTGADTPLTVTVLGSDVATVPAAAIVSVGAYSLVIFSRED